MSVRVALACAMDVERTLRQALECGGDIAVVGRLATSRGAPIEPGAAVLVVDVESLGATGLDLIGDVMRNSPLPVLALCPSGPSGASASAKALRHGAVDAIPRAAGLDRGGEFLRRRVHLVRGVSVVRRTQPPPPVRHTAAGSIVAMAASTGGPAALATVLGRLGGLPVPVLVVQHLHGDFMDGFVTWLAARSPLPVSTAQHGTTPRAGHVYVAPDGYHLRLASGRRLVLDERPLTTHRPSADELFCSVAAAAGASGVGVLLTGMGRDGAVGLLAMRRAGAYTLVQDEESSAVFGMPRAALGLGAADVGQSLEDIAADILDAVGVAGPR